MYEEEETNYHSIRSYPLFENLLKNIVTEKLRKDIIEYKDLEFIQFLIQKNILLKRS